MDPALLPRVLVIDDQYGRECAGPNEDRLNFCRTYRLVDVTSQDSRKSRVARVPDPIAEAVFCRGQLPVTATVGDVVLNDMAGILDIVFHGHEFRAGNPTWALVLLDLCFYTGEVTDQSENLRGVGMPLGRPEDEEAATCFGLRVLTELTQHFPDLPIAILSSIPRWQVSEEYIRRGAVGFLPKSEIRGPDLISDYLLHHALLPDFRGEILGCSKVLLQMLRAARRSAQHDRPVLMRGERGTGKELLARYIHHYRSRSGQVPFVPVNCGQLADPNMAFSALFGHRKGAYTGADSDRLGAVQNAAGGILFLDEIGNLSVQVQAGLHRLLQEGEFAPLGSEEKPIRNVRVKLLAATNSDIEGLTLKDPPQFYPDLLDRMKLGDVIHLPPLRERLEDLPLLIAGFVRQAEQEIEGAHIGREIDDGVYDLLSSYDWPGNIRELESCIKRAVNTYKHMERLVPRSIEIPSSKNTFVRPRSASPSRHDVTDVESTSAQVHSYDPRQPQALAGRLEDIQLRHAREIAAYLDAVLQATSRPTIDHPEGQLLLHPAAKLMTGSRSMSASEAADLFKRLLRPLEKFNNGTLLTPRLREAIARAIQMRPSRSRDDNGSPQT
ncbi:MAG: sigma-54-dependent Fis family transcriptional regulator [Acidobacteria bacterium]|nr:sigma-54-dependent Fis family transcriptional regulator [Acidobacteriota bacterium]